MRILCAVLFLVGGGSWLSANEPVDGFKVIVHPGVTGATVRRDVLAQIFLGNAQYWGDGSRIVAVDLSATSTVREAFSRQVLGMAVDGVKHHWLRTIAANKVKPPAIKTSDDDVIAFVAAESGGVGYVSSEAEIPSSVRMVEVR